LLNSNKPSSALKANRGIFIHLLCLRLESDSLLTFSADPKYPWHMSNLVAFLRLNLFVKIDLWQWANYPVIRPGKPPDKNGQLSFNF
jgi:hypothetical protein